MLIQTDYFVLYVVGLLALQVTLDHVSHVTITCTIKTGMTIRTYLKHLDASLFWQVLLNVIYTFIDLRCKLSQCFVFS